MTLTPAAKKITHVRLLEVVSYDPETGVFRWKVATSRKTRVGTVMATRSKCTRGGIYLQGRIDGRIYRLHRLAWLYMTGAWPCAEVDHINGDPTDNRWANLRDVPRSMNQQNIRVAKRNSKTGLLGAFPARRGRYRAAIRTGSLLDEYNRTRTNFRTHRSRAIPKTGFDRGTMDPLDAKRLEDASSNEMVGLDLQGQRPDQVLFPISYNQIDPALYDTQVIRAELEMIWGVQEALSSSIQVAKTATRRRWPGLRGQRKRLREISLRNSTLFAVLAGTMTSRSWWI